VSLKDVRHFLKTGLENNSKGVTKNIQMTRRAASKKRLIKKAIDDAAPGLPGMSPAA